MEIDQDGVDRAERLLGQQPVHAGEGIVDCIHEQTRHGIHHHQAAPVGQREDAMALARRARREVDRSQQAGIAVDVGDDLAFVPDMVAGGDDIDPGGIELGADLVGDAEAMRRVLAIDDDEIERELTPEARHMRDHNLAARAADDIAAEQEPHARSVLVAGNVCGSRLITPRARHPTPQDAPRRGREGEDGAASAVGIA